MLFIFHIDKDVFLLIFCAPYNQGFKIILIILWMVEKGGILKCCSVFLKGLSNFFDPFWFWILISRSKICSLFFLSNACHDFSLWNHIFFFFLLQYKHQIWRLADLPFVTTTEHLADAVCSASQLSDKFSIFLSIPFTTLCVTFSFSICGYIFRLKLLRHWVHAIPFCLAQ